MKTIKELQDEIELIIMRFKDLPVSYKGLLVRDIRAKFKEYKNEE